MKKFIIAFVLALLVSGTAYAQVPSFPEDGGWIAVYGGQTFVNETSHSFLNCSFHDPMGSVTIDGATYPVAIYPAHAYLLLRGHSVRFNNTPNISLCQMDGSAWASVDNLSILPYRVYLPVVLR